MNASNHGKRDGNLYLLIDAKRGDAGKAKILVDKLSSGDIQMTIRPIGGAGSGRTAVINGIKTVFAQLPEGIAFDGVTGAIGHMAYVYPDAFQFRHRELADLFNSKKGLLQEMTSFQDLGLYRGHLVISPRAALGMPWHLVQDMLEEILRCPDDIGTTVNGMGPIAASYLGRNGLRMEDMLRERQAFKRRFETAYRMSSAYTYGLLLQVRRHVNRLTEPEQRKLAGRFCGWSETKSETAYEAIENLLFALGTEDCMGGSEKRVFSWLDNARKKLAGTIAAIEPLVRKNRERGEGLAVCATNGRKLHPVFGDYPNVTTSLISVQGILEMSGLPASAVCSPNAHVIAAIKAYDSHVGEGHFPTELANPTGDWIRNKGNEYGTVTKRPRRVGWLDLVSARTGMANQDCNELSVTRLDILSGLTELKICTAYDHDGKIITAVTEDVRIERCVPVYKTLSGWTENIDGATELGSLPAPAIEYLKTIQAELGCRITHVGTGPGQGECVHCDGIA